MLKIYTNENIEKVNDERFFKTEPFKALLFKIGNRNIVISANRHLGQVTKENMDKAGLSITPRGRIIAMPDTKNEYGVFVYKGKTPIYNIELDYSSLEIIDYRIFNNQLLLFFRKKYNSSNAIKIFESNMVRVYYFKEDGSIGNHTISKDNIVKQHIKLKRLPLPKRRDKVLMKKYEEQERTVESLSNASEVVNIYKECIDITKVNKDNNELIEAINKLDNVNIYVNSADYSNELHQLLIDENLEEKKCRFYVILNLENRNFKRLSLNKNNKTL